MSNENKTQDRVISVSSSFQIQNSMLDVRCSMFICSPALKLYSTIRNPVFCLLTSLIYILVDKAPFRVRFEPTRSACGESAQLLMKNPVEVPRGSRTESLTLQPLYPNSAIPTIPYATTAHPRRVVKPQLMAICAATG